MRQRTCDRTGRPGRRGEGLPPIISSMRCRCEAGQIVAALLADPGRNRLQADPDRAHGFGPAGLPAGGDWARTNRSNCGSGKTGQPLYPSGFGTLAPSEVAPIVEPDIVVMPLLGFDRHGTRLGYGKGYYDRTLAQMGTKPLLVGYAFAAQELDFIPREAHDVPLDMLVTENGARRFDKAEAASA